MGDRIERSFAVAFGLARQRDRETSDARSDPRQEETGRGRSAETPSEIPAMGWKDILLRVYRGISENRILLVAAGVTFYALLAIFPGIAALISIYGLFADPASVAGNLDTMANVAPGGAIHVLREEMNRLASQGGATLGASFLVSLAISLWTANSGVNAIFDALNIVYGEEEKRSFSQTQCYHATRHAWNSCLYPAHARSNCRHTGCFSVYPASGSDSSYR